MNAANRNPTPSRRHFSRLAPAACWAAIVTMALCPVATLQPAAADVIHLNTGGVVKGTIVGEDDREVRVRTSTGATTTIFREDIERIEVGETPDQIYRKRLNDLEKGDIGGHYDLGMWCRKVRLKELASDEFEKVIILDPGHPFARDQLGYVRNGGGWTLRGSNQVEGTADGEFDMDDLVAASRDLADDSLDAPRSSSRRSKRSHRTPSLSDETRGLISDVRSADTETRKAAYAKLTTLAENQTEKLLSQMLGDDERARNQAFRVVGRNSPAVEEIQTRVATEQAPTREELLPHVTEFVATRVVEPTYSRVATLETSLIRDQARTNKKLRRLMRDYGIEAATERRLKVLRWWEDGREEALKTIFDKKIYPDENHGRAGQPIVDEKVDKVREVWEFYELLVDTDTAHFRNLGSDQAANILEGITNKRATLADCSSFLAALPGDHVPTLEASELPVVFEALLRYRSGDIDGAWAMASKLTKWEARLLERLRDHRIYEYNASLANAKIDKGKNPTGEEVEQVRVTNDYRRMMGRIPLELDACLIDSARGHSEEMTRLGYFAHDSPVGANRSPSDRARNAGYVGPIGENIAMGSEAPMAAHIAWYNSSGHHRNILGPRWLCMGSGKDGRHWTQNFGSRTQLKR